MKSIEVFLDNLITTDKYDERLALYIKEFFLYNARYFGWNQNTILEKEKILQRRIKGFEFIYLPDKTSDVDYDSKNILLDSRIKRIEYDKNSAVALIGKIFENLDILTREGNTNIPDIIEYGKTTRSLKYCVNQKEKERIMSIISIDLNKSAEKIYDLGHEYNLINYANSILKSNDKTEILYTYLCWYEDVLNNLNIDAFYRIYQKGKSDEEKIETIKTLRRINSVMQKIVEEERDAIPDTSDPKFKKFKKVLERIKKKMDKVREDNKVKTAEILDDEEIKIDNFKERIPDHLIKMSKPEFDDTELTDSYLQQKTSILAENYKEKFRPIIMEYFIRSAKIYNWSKEEFDKKIRNFSINCKKIEYLKRSEQKDGTIGFWRRDKSKVEVKISNMKPINIFGVFLHEFEHATDETIREDKIYEDTMLSNINETATEIGAVIMVGEKPYYDKLNFFINTRGYGFTKQAIGIMSAALGINEFEFAKIRDNGLLESDFMEKFKYLDILYVFKRYNKILGDMIDAYDDDKSDDTSKILSSAYLKVFDLAKEVLEKRIKYENKTLAGQNKDISDVKIKYEKAKIAQNMKNAIREYGLQGIDEKGFIEENGKITFEDMKYFMYMLKLIHYYDDYINSNNIDILKHIRDEIKYPIIGKAKRIFAKLHKNLVLAEGEDELDDDFENFDSDSSQSMIRDASEFKNRISYNPKKRGLLNRRRDDRVDNEKSNDKVRDL